MPGQDWKDKLASLLRSSPGTQPAMAAQMPTPTPSPPAMGGMAGQAQAILQSRPYQLHLQESQALGQQPMTPEQFAMQGR